MNKGLHVTKNPKVQKQILFSTDPLLGEGVLLISLKFFFFLIALSMSVYKTSYRLKSINKPSIEI